MNICIKTIPHKKQRYPTVGDWVCDKHGDITIKVSAMGDWRYECLVAVHELVEVLICKWTKVSQKDVDKFDMEYEKNRGCCDFDEPGDDPKSPYRSAHCIATGVERTLAAVLGVNWRKYEDKIDSL